MSGLLLIPFAVQALLMMVDEFYYHHKRGLPLWERLGHPLDTLTVIAAVGFLIRNDANPSNLAVYAGLALFSSLFVTKDEWVHSEECEPGENWLHSLLLVMHPIALGAAAGLWILKQRGSLWPALDNVLEIQLLILIGFGMYQLIYWNLFRPSAAEINNEIYDSLGEKWYEGQDDPVALLRAQSKVQVKWIRDEIKELFGDRKLKILDLGCGGGFYTNTLAKDGHSVTGVDLSSESLEVAGSHDETKSVTYVRANALEPGLPHRSFDVVLSLDFIEHIEEPKRLVSEISRLLKPKGVFFFHTFNRNPLSGLVVIKFMEWFVKNTPKNLHIYRLFVKPKEFNGFCESSGLSVRKWRGILPKLFSWKVITAVLRGIVPPDLEFQINDSLLVSYMGFATKER